MPERFAKGYCACPGCGQPMSKQASRCLACMPLPSEKAPVGRTVALPALTLAQTRTLLWTHGLGPLGAFSQQPGDAEATAWRMPGGHGLTQRHAVGGKGYWGEVVR